MPIDHAAPCDAGTIPYSARIMKTSVGAMLAPLLLLVYGCAREEQHVLAGGREIESWLEEIHDPSPRARRQAVQKLGNVGEEDPAVAEALCEALQDSDAQV